MVKTLLATQNQISKMSSAIQGLWICVFSKMNITQVISSTILISSTTRVERKLSTCLLYCHQHQTRLMFVWLEKRVKLGKYRLLLSTVIALQGLKKFKIFWIPHGFFNKFIKNKLCFCWQILNLMSSWFLLLQ